MTARFRLLLSRVPPGVGLTALWFVAAANLLRGHLGLPGLPSGLPGLPPWAWPAVAAAMVAAIAAGRLLPRRPVTALALLTGASLAVAAAAAPAAGPALEVAWFLLAGEFGLGYLVAMCSPSRWPAGFALVLGFLPAYGGLRRLTGDTSGFEPGVTSGQWGWWLSFAVMPTAVAGLIGYSLRQARSYTRRLSAQAAAQAVVAERLRISRELHDHVAHNVGIIALQAGAAARVMATRPDEAHAAMLAVETTGRETLAGLRRMLGALRETAPAALHPAPGLADVEHLAAATTAAGVRVDLRWTGDPRGMPPEVDLSAYRIIQESLTNVLRHARADSCEVAVGYLPAELAIEITDAGRGPSAEQGHGYGLVGLRERVALLSGSFSAAPRPEGGFRVTARLPAPELS